MARYKGKDAVIQAGANDIGEVESFDITISVNQIDADVIGIDWTSVEAGKFTAQGSVNCLRDPGDAGQTAFAVGAIVAMTFLMEGNTSGLSTITGDFLVTEVQSSVAANDLVKDVYNFRNNGAVTVGTIA